MSPANPAVFEAIRQLPEDVHKIVAFCCFAMPGKLSLIDECAILKLRFEELRHFTSDHVPGIHFWLIRKEVCGNPNPNINLFEWVQRMHEDEKASHQNVMVGFLGLAKEQGFYVPHDLGDS